MVNAPLCNSLYLFLSFLCHPYIFTIFVENFYYFYTIYKSVKGLQRIGSSFWPYVPKRAFHMMWISAAYLVVVASQAQESCRGIFIRIGGLIMTLFQKCLMMSNPGWAPDQPMDHILHACGTCPYVNIWLPCWPILTFRILFPYSARLGPNCANLASILTPVLVLETCAYK